MHRTGPWLRAAEGAMLRRKVRHEGPVVVHMGDAVRCKQVPVARAEDDRIADLDRVPGTWWKEGQERFQPVKKLVDRQAGSLEFEQKDPQIRAQSLLSGLIDHIPKEIRVEESGVSSSGFGPVTGEACKGRDRQLFPHLEAEVEGRRDLGSIGCQLGRRSRTIKGMIDPDGIEQGAVLMPKGGVFGQTLSAEPALGIGTMVDQALPTFIGP